MYQVHYKADVWRREGTTGHERRDFPEAECRFNTLSFGLDINGTFGIFKVQDFVCGYFGCTIPDGKVKRGMIGIELPEYLGNGSLIKLLRLLQDCNFPFAPCLFRIGNDLQKQSVKACFLEDQDISLRIFNNLS